MSSALRVLVCAGCFAVPTLTAATTAHRNPPAVPNVGVASKSLRLIAIIPRDYPDRTSLGDFVRALPSSQWLAGLQKAYPRSAGSPGNKAATVLVVDDMPELLHQSRTVVSYQDYVYTTARAAGLGVDKARQTIYLLFIRCADPYGMDSFGCVSHHPSLNPQRVVPGGHSESDLFRSGDSMAVVLPETGTVDGRTTAATHEVAEAYTNTPGVGQWRLHSLHSADPWLDAPPWVRSTGTIELADLTEGSFWFETDPVTHQTFRDSRVYSTFRSTQGFDDVAVPSQPNPLYSVSTAAGSWPNDWHPYTWPATISIPVTAWAESGVGNFTVTASIATFGGNVPHPCTLSRTTWTVHDGSTFRLRLTTADVTDGGKHIWCTVALKSTRPTPPSHDDSSHTWMVGVLVVGPH